MGVVKVEFVMTELYLVDNSVLKRVSSLHQFGVDSYNFKLMCGCVFVFVFVTTGLHMIILMLRLNVFCWSD